jgi:nucleoside phosphorylase
LKHNKVELSAAAKRCKRKPKIEQGKSFAYYRIGLCGSVEVAAVQCNMGTSTPGGSLQTIQACIDDLRPKVVILVGVAFGMDKNRQRIGHILVSQKISCYDPEKIVKKPRCAPYSIKRGDTTTVPVRLLSVFKTWTGEGFWDKIPVHFGELVSGEKLIDNKIFKAELRKKYPEAIGGEMEAAGAYCASSFGKTGL